MLDAAKHLLASKKFQTFLLGLLVAGGAKLGLEVSDELAAAILGATAILIGAQGAADHGKEAAKQYVSNLCPNCGAEADAPATEEVKEPSPEAGFARIELTAMAAVVGIMLGLVAACGWLSRETKATGRNVIDCTVPAARELGQQFGPTVDAVLQGSLSDQGRLDRATVKALAASYVTDAARCVLASAINRLLYPRDQGPPYAAPLQVNLADVAELWAELQREQFGDRPFKLGDAP
jgi:hypothetical protein